MSDDNRKDTSQAAVPSPTEEQATATEEQASPAITGKEPSPATQKASSPTSASSSVPTGAQASPAGASRSDAEKEAKAKAAAEARAARANARAKKSEEAEDAAPKEPSPLQPRLDYFVKLLRESLGEDCVEDAFINEKDAHLPCVILENSKWLAAAELLKDHSELQFNYLRNVSGVDYETHMEVVYHLLSLVSKHELCVKVKTEREAASVPSVTPVWPTANWNEREIYDLLGIDFPGHPDLRRIMMSDDWVGHPLRKDYQPLDPEV
ncbi:NADH-quinone oxidoreductase subunit C [Paenibacillus xerothermodurans]|uniref:NADH-quinone oxidoreductase subunit C n=1 Tax=Paenibacillus xerothermodurans TaxID=1977292 RepID=A0A2W1NIQ7_PAEXE|nr:NADH-quinone oxidoreductase subunit C [Paenibacillus xerothermodurans]PZE19395.1 NADH-quinone oxidoreductase subunit C [Paenibacillus xerothermodurans]